MCGASGCDQCVGPVDVVTGCGQWVVDLLDYLVIQYHTHCSMFSKRKIIFYSICLVKCLGKFFDYALQ